MALDAAEGGLAWGGVVTQQSGQVWLRPGLWAGGWGEHRRLGGAAGG